MCENRKWSYRNYSILSLPYTIFNSHIFFPYQIHFYACEHKYSRKLQTRKISRLCNKCLWKKKTPSFHLQGFLGVTVRKSGPKDVITHMQEVGNFSAIYSHPFSCFLMTTREIIYRLETDMFPFLRTAIKHHWEKEIIFFCWQLLNGILCSCGNTSQWKEFCSSVFIL